MNHIIRKSITLAIACLGLSAGLAQAQVEMNMERAEVIIPREHKSGPIKSLIPGEEAEIADTLDTSDPQVKLILFKDHTWKYVKDSAIEPTDVYDEDWNDAISPYKTSLSDLPSTVTLWLVDDLSGYCCPRQTKPSSKFGIRHRRRHQGTDLPLDKGTPVYAAFDGKVRLSQYTKGYGNLVVVRHANGLETFYGHLSRRDVQPGDMVRAGDVIGLGGSTGRSTGPHLHFETRYQGYAFDPEWMIDFSDGSLRNGVFTLKKKYLSASSRYVPESEEVEDEIILDDEADQKVAAEKQAKAEKAAAASKKYYTIRKGDTLGKIAKKNGTTVKKLCQLNGMTTKTILRVGKKIRVK